VNTKKKLTIPEIAAWDGTKRKLRMLTAYDYPSARIIDQTDIELILVGDSLGMVVLGYPTTLPVTLDDMIRHTQAVVRGAPGTLVVADLPFLSYQTSPEAAVANAGRLIKETGADAVKLEGGAHFADTVRALVRAGIPVMGHLGLTPQNAVQLGGFKVQARTAPAARRLLADAQALVAAGIFALVLESIPMEVARRVTELVPVPTIGIGAGPYCDGQVLVWHDVLGLYDRFVPKFAKQYARLGEQIREAIQAFAQEVAAGTFPAAEHCFQMPAAEWEKFKESGGG